MAYITTKISASRLNIELSSGTKYDFPEGTEDANGDYTYVPPVVESFDDLLARHTAEVAGVVKDLDLSDEQNEFEF